MLNRVLDRYASWYDITRLEEGEQSLVATAAYHEHRTGFAVVRKAEMWSADNHEYVYFFSLPELTAESFDACFAQAMSMGEQLVNPVKGHMCTAISVVCICDHVREDARQKVKQCRFRKSFQFSLRGWMEARACAVDLEESAAFANASGREIERFMTNILHPKKKKRKKSIIQALLNRE